MVAEPEGQVLSNVLPIEIHVQWTLEDLVVEVRGCVADVDDAPCGNGDPVEVDVAAIEALGVGRVHAEDVMCAVSYVRHDPVRTARALVWLFDALGTPERTTRRAARGSGGGVVGNAS